MPDGARRGTARGLPDLQLLVVAAVLVLLAGLFAMTDAALVDRLAGPGRGAGPRGAARRRARCTRSPPTSSGTLNLLLLLRLLCELTATTLVALVAIDSCGAGWRGRAGHRRRR